MPGSSLSHKYSNIHISLLTTGNLVTAKGFLCLCWPTATSDPLASLMAVSEVTVMKTYPAPQSS